MYYSYLYYYNELPIYVGKGSGNRANVHIQYGSHNLYLDRKLKKMKKENLDTIIKIIPTENEPEAYELEKFLIEIIGRKDLKTGSLLNNTTGGEGNSFPGEKNPRFGDHRNLIELCGIERANQIKVKYSQRYSGIKNPMYGKSRKDLNLRNTIDNPSKICWSCINCKKLKHGVNNLNKHWRICHV